MDFPFTVWVAFLALAGMVGFFADRASICNVKAVEEILTTGRARMLASFGKTILWVTGITIWLAWWLGVASPHHPGFGIVWPGVVGGLLFGVGAVLNDGCAFSTLTRLGNGNLGMFVTLTGFVAGAAFFEWANIMGTGIGATTAAPWVELDVVSATAVGIVLTLWMIWELRRLWRSAPSAHWWALMASPRYRLSTAAAVIGISNGILYAMLGTWSYTHTLKLGVRQVIAPGDAAIDPMRMNLLWWLFVALLFGVILSSALGRRFDLSWRPRQQWLSFFFGGSLMGMGAAAVPGGNDVLLLNAIPGLSPHALPAYLAMLVGIWIALMVFKWRGGAWQVVDCGGDRCLDSVGLPIDKPR
jgi:uncharacterized membrane protein YedE/YeeE